MGCYNCGSSEGGPHTLCPPCNQERHYQKEIRRMEMRGIDVNGVRAMDAVAQFLFLAIIGLFAVGTYLILFAEGGPGYGITFLETYVQ